MSRRWGIWVKGLETWCKDGYTLVSEGKYKPEYCLFSTKKEAEKAVRDELKALGYSNVNFSDDGWSYRYNAFRL